MPAVPAAQSYQTDWEAILSTSPADFITSVSAWMLPPEWAGAEGPPPPVRPLRELPPVRPFFLRPFGFLGGGDMKGRRCWRVARGRHRRALRPLHELPAEAFFVS